VSDIGSAIIPPTVEVRLQHKRTKAWRTYEQTELAIEGEARLLGLIHHTGVALTASDFPWDLLGQLFSDASASIDWQKAITLLGSVSIAAPNAVADSALIFFGIYPVNEDGTPNTAYDDHRAFIKGALTFTGWTGLVRTFTEQNDYQRLITPFAQALAAGATLARANSAPTGA
jgi:hypothetical protein